VRTALRIFHALLTSDTLICLRYFETGFIADA